jgi:hypothetical protein
MNKPITLIAAIGLLITFGGCAQPYPNYGYGNIYRGQSSGYGSYQGYGNGYSAYQGYNNGYNNNGRYERHEYRGNSSKQEGPTQQQKAVKALRDAAKNGADPASTLYQQMLIQQMH